MHPFKVYSSVIFNIVTTLCNQHHYLLIIPEHLHHPRRKVCIHCSHWPSLVSSSPWQPLIYSLSTDISLWTFHRSGILQCVLQGSPMLLHVSIVHAFHLQIIFYYINKFYPFITQILELFPLLGLLWIMLLRIFMDRFLCSHAFSLFLGTRVGKLLACMQCCMDTCYNMDEPWKHDTQWKTPRTADCMLPLTWNVHDRKIHSDKKKGVAWWWAEGGRGGCNSFVVVVIFKKIYF